MTHVLRSNSRCYAAPIRIIMLSRNGDAVCVSGPALNQRILVTRSRARHPRTRAWIRTAAAPRRRFVAARSSISGMAWLYRVNNNLRSMRFLAVFRTMYPRAYRSIGPGRYCSPHHTGCHFGRHQINRKRYKMRVDDVVESICQVLSGRCRSTRHIACHLGGKCLQGPAAVWYDTPPPRVIPAWRCR